MPIRRRISVEARSSGYLIVNAIKRYEYWLVSSGYYDSPWRWWSMVLSLRLQETSKNTGNLLLETTHNSIHYLSDLLIKIVYTLVYTYTCTCTHIRSMSIVRCMHMYAGDVISSKPTKNREHKDKRYTVTQHQPSLLRDSHKFSEDESLICYVTTMMRMNNQRSAITD